jgi:hypothetical protein
MPDWPNRRIQQGFRECSVNFATLDQIEKRFHDGDLIARRTFHVATPTSQGLGNKGAANDKVGGKLRSCHNAMPHINRACDSRRRQIVADW